MTEIPGPPPEEDESDELSLAQAADQRRNLKSFQRIQNFAMRFADERTSEFGYHFGIQPEDGSGIDPNAELVAWMELNREYKGVPVQFLTSIASSQQLASQDYIPGSVGSISFMLPGQDHESSMHLMISGDGDVDAEAGRLPLPSTPKEQRQLDRYQQVAEDFGMYFTQGEDGVSVGLNDLEAFADAFEIVAPMKL